MSHIDETAYPQLKAEPTAQELESIYTPSAAEKTLSLRNISGSRPELSC